MGWDIAIWKRTSTSGRDLIASVRYGNIPDSSWEELLGQSWDVDVAFEKPVDWHGIRARLISWLAAHNNTTYNTIWITEFLAGVDMVLTKANQDDYTIIVG